VRRLEEAVRRVRAGEDVDVTAAAEDADFGTASATPDAERSVRPASDDDERWTRLLIDVPAGGQEIIDAGLALARKAIERPTAPKWELLEWIAAEVRSCGDWAVDCETLRAPGAQGSDASAGLGSLDMLGESLDDHCAYWASIVQVPPIEAPDADARLLRDPKLIDAKLRRHIAMLERWDLLFGHLALVFKTIRGWEIAGFHSLAHYSRERLGMAARTVEQRIALEGRLYDLPALRAALLDGRISYEKARLIARHSDRASLETRIDEAQRATCIALRRRFEADDDAQMSARRKFKAVVPWRVACDVEDAFRTIRQRSAAPLSSGECLVAMFADFIDVWTPLLARRTTLQKRVLERDGYLCQVPGCSRAAAHAHHIQSRAAGGPDEMWNLTSLCAAHHLRGVHMGRLRVTGRAPDQLRWTLKGALPEIEGRWPAVAVAA
jgi:hypothetical protein